MPRQKPPQMDQFQKFARCAKRTYYAQDLKIEVPMEVVLPPNGTRTSEVNRSKQSPAKSAYDSPKSGRKTSGCPDASGRGFYGLSDSATSPGIKEGSVFRTCTVAFSNDDFMSSHFSEHTALPVPSERFKRLLSKATMNSGSQHIGAESTEVAVSAHTTSLTSILREASSHHLPSDVKIGDQPTIKIIAETYRKCQNHNVELRVLESRVVCVEYQVCRAGQPLHTLKVYFSLKPQFLDASGKCDDETIEASYRQAFESLAQTHSAETHNELEIIDGKLAENRPYLRDLKRIIQQQRKQQDRDKKSKIDVLDLYRLAKRQRLPKSDASVLNAKQLQEMKAMILKQCVSSMQGLARRKLGDAAQTSKSDCGLIPKHILDEMLASNVR